MRNERKLSEESCLMSLNYCLLEQTRIASYHENSSSHTFSTRLDKTVDHTLQTIVVDSVIQCLILESFGCLPTICIDLLCAKERVVHQILVPSHHTIPPT